MHVLLTIYSTPVIETRLYSCNTLFVFFLFTVITNCTWPQTRPVTLNCTGPKKVYITNVTLGRSECVDQECCPNKTDCITEADTQHFGYVKNRCNEKQMCTIFLLSGWCSGPGGGQTDYESVHYVCSSIDPGE